MGVIDSADRVQRRFSVIGYPLAVIYKFFDDQGSYLASIITYYAFIAIFPLLLLGSSILGFFLQDNPELQKELLDSALAQFPIIGDQLGRPEGLQGSTAGVVIGALAALYGSLGLGQALQNALNIAWSVPRNSRPNPFLLRLKSLLLLSTAGIAVLALSVLSALAGNTDVLGDSIASYRWPITVATLVVVAGLFTLLFRVGTARTHPLRAALPGAIVTTLLLQLLQYIGTAYVTNVVTESAGMNQIFAVVLGLMGLIYIAAVMGMLGIEVNVVLERRLWPRALLTPFTDKVDLTEADKRAYSSYARAQRHKGFENVEVTFTDSMKLRVVQIEPDDDADHAS